ncbi:SIR2-like domain-containing protein [Tardiphaga sp. OK246]|uniref:SIR2 family protein n=1 Tax=Tardiphaga sp. OK246 TaxID=1855307 RepID=UPI000B68BE7C|nr:SIR2 family protein [Tardiphaga sp. OK246]SNT61660.1 SIR2-like domain-containing protein [Tardiphaga sp. OK246]
MTEASSIEATAKLAQRCFASNPVVILGSGASLHHGLPGMTDLQEALAADIQADAGAEADAWHQVQAALSSGNHLEQALGATALPASLTAKIISATWNCISKKDREVYLRAVVGSENFPISDLLQRLFQSTNTSINIVTTNYDRLAEYASDAAGIAFATGFLPGYIQAREGSDRITISRGGKAARTARIWKVHGSLDWFQRSDGTVVSAALFELPAALLPLIVSPGVSKFERTHDEPFRSAIQGADRALEHALGYLCIGFGFRDTHIEPKLVERCRNTNVPIVVLARSLTEEAKAFLKSKAGSSYLALEESCGGTRAYSHQHPDGIDLPGDDFWSLNGFMRLVT